jgi:hypothetical protein
VLAKAGFVPADPARIGGKHGTWCQRVLAAGDALRQHAAATDQAGDWLAAIDAIDATAGFHVISTKFLTGQNSPWNAAMRSSDSCVTQSKIQLRVVYAKMSLLSYIQHVLTIP